jgi:hypothetical protein
MEDNWGRKNKVKLPSRGLKPIHHEGRRNGELLNAWKVF